MDKAEYKRTVEQALTELLEKDTSTWKFREWRVNGIDCFLADELVYLFCEYFDPPEYIVDNYSVEEIAKTIWKYVRNMDEFPRFWQSHESKTEILGEFIKALTDPTFLQEQQ